jgi:ABC-type sugar transport system ATPase subunit
MGAETLVHARIGSGPGGEIRVVLPRAARVEVGATLHLRADASQTHVFDASGKAIRT